MCQLHAASWGADGRVDGIVNVSAKDKATNKDQSMTIASSSGLSDKEIERMVEESEQFAEQDKTRKQLIEESNRAESVSNDTEKGASRSCCARVSAAHPAPQRCPSTRTSLRAASARR